MTAQPQPQIMPMHLVWDTNNNRMLRALGAGTTDGWRIVDGSATVTPA